MAAAMKSVAILSDVGPHPMTGEPFIAGSVMREQPYDTIHTPLKPQPPEERIAVRWETVWYDDGEEYEEPVEWRDRTPKEMAKALALYEKALKAWAPTVRYLAGPAVETAKLETLSGSTATFRRAGGAWRCDEWTAKGGR